MSKPLALLECDEVLRSDSEGADASARSERHDSNSGGESGSGGESISFKDIESPPLKRRRVAPPAPPEKAWIARIAKACACGPIEAAQTLDYLQFQLRNIITNANKIEGLELSMSLDMTLTELAYFCFIAETCAAKRKELGGALTILQWMGALQAIYVSMLYLEDLFMVRLPIRTFSSMSYMTVKKMSHVVLSLTWAFGDLFVRYQHAFVADYMGGADKIQVNPQTYF